MYTSKPSQPAFCSAQTYFFIMYEQALFLFIGPTCTVDHLASQKPNNLLPTGFSMYENNVIPCDTICIVFFFCC